VSRGYREREGSSALKLSTCLDEFGHARYERRVIFFALVRERCCQLQSIKEGGTPCFEFETASHHFKTHFIYTEALVA